MAAQWDAPLILMEQLRQFWYPVSENQFVCLSLTIRKI
jgi:hypothetical protein